MRRLLFFFTVLLISSRGQALIYAEKISENVFPQVVSLSWQKIVSKKKVEKKATAVFVGKNVLLTSAHFFYVKDIKREQELSGGEGNVKLAKRDIGKWKGKKLFVNGESVEIQGNVWVHPDFNSEKFLKKKLSDIDTNDVALVILKKPVDFEPMVISKEPLRFTEKVHMIGYGQYFPKSFVNMADFLKAYSLADPEEMLSSKKSVGTNGAVELFGVLPKNTYQFLVDAVEYNGKEYYKSGILPGDSGGPLLNEKGEIVGLAHKVTGSEIHMISVFIDVTRPEVREKIQKIMAESAQL